METSDTATTQEVVPMEAEEQPAMEIVNISTVCRICGDQLREKLMNFYDEEGRSNELAKKINLYLPIKVTENDRLPLQSCISCATAVIMWHDLYLRAAESDRNFQSGYFDMESRLETIDIQIKSLDEEDEEDVDEPDALILPISNLNEFCHTVLDKSAPESAAPVKRSKRIYDKRKTEPVLASYSSDESLESDEKKCKVEEIDTSPPSDGATIVDSCEEKLTAPAYSCHYCNAIFVQKRAATKHVKTKHPEEEIIVTKVEQEGDNGDKKNTHRSSNNKIDQELTEAAKVVVDGRVYYNCKECGKSLHSPYTYVWHMRIHTGERPYVCDLCGKQFRVSQGLVRHLRETHQGIKKFPCDICGRMFATRRNVEEHRRIHTNERPYICDLCGKSFKQKASLFVHKRSHKNHFPFKCSYCSQGFRTKPPLLIHITRHTGEKPYKCEYCDRCFRIKYELKRHKLIHSDEKPFRCMCCGMSFRQKRYLKNHMKANHAALCTSNDWDT